MPRRRVILLLTTALLLVYAWSDPALAQAPVRLFLSTSDAGVPRQVDRWALGVVSRGRSAQVNPDLFQQLQSLPAGGELLLELNLFPDSTWTVRLRASPSEANGCRAYSGRLVERPESQVLLVLRGDLLAGSILTPGQPSIQIAPRGRHACELSELYLPTGPVCGMGTPVDAAETALKSVDAAGSNARRAGLMATTEPAASVPPREIEVMMVYTADAREAAFGTETFEVLAQLSIEEANVALANSQTGVQFRLVHTAEVIYGETGALDLDLARLRGLDDGYLDEVHALRDTHQADLVCLIVNSSSRYGGIGYFATGADSAFSVLQRFYMTGYGLVAHELGHNLGCDHDRENSSGGGAFPYSYGHRLTIDDQTYRTVMCYAPGWPIAHFSNPEVSFRDVPTGIPAGADEQADNARTIRQLAATIDGYRGLVVTLAEPAPGAVFASGEPIVLKAEVASAEGAVLGVEFYDGDVLLGEAVAPPYSISWSGADSGTHELRARARVDSDLVATSPEVAVGVRPVNDDFSARLPLTGVNVATTTSLYAATPEIGEPILGPATRSSWWSWTAPESGTARVAVAGPDAVRVRAGVFLGSELEGLQRIAASPAGGRDVLFTAQAGMEYQICVQGEGTLHPVSLYITMLPPPANDDFARAQTIAGPGITKGSTVGATQQPGEPAIGARPIGHSIWYVWTPAASGLGTLALTPTTSGEMDFAVYSGESLDTLTLAANSRDASRGFPVQANATYYVAVDGDYDEFLLSVKLVAPPSNDDFARRITLNVSLASFLVNTLGATQEPLEPVHGPLPGGHSIWLSWRAMATGAVRITRMTLSSVRPLPLSMAWYTGTDLTNLQAVTKVQFTNTLQESVLIPVIRNTNYHIALDSSGAISNQYLRFEFRTTTSNDRFRQPQNFPPAPARLTGTTLAATAEPGEPPHGGIPGAHSVWWTWSPRTNGLVAFTIDGSGDTLPRLSVYTGEILTNLTLVAENSTAGVINPNVTFEAQVGQRYRIAIDEDTSSFSYTLAASNVIPPANDDFAKRQIISPLAQNVSGSTLGATLEPDEPLLSPEFVSSVWYSWTSNADIPVTILAGGRRGGGALSELRAALPDAVVSVFQGGALTELAPVATGIGSASFQARRGVRYEIAISSLAGQQQDFALSVVSVPLNDAFKRATVLSDIGVAAFTTAALLRSATVEPSEPNHAGAASGHSLWWSWLARLSGEYTWSTRLNANPSIPQPAIIAAIYTGGPELENLNVVASNAWGNVVFTAEANTRYYMALDLRDSRVSLASAAGSPIAFSLVRQPGFLPPVQRRAGPLEFVVAGTPGQVISLERSVDLQRWDFVRNVTLTAAEYKIPETPPDGPGQRFYRLILLSSPY